MEQKTLTISQLANELGVSRTTIWRMRQSDELPAPLPIGRGVRYRKSDIELWLTLECPDREQFAALKATKQRFAKVAR
ncbi:MAG: helix-turn-helix domain-containing protein [Planctomycetota bacterium]